MSTSSRCSWSCYLQWRFGSRVCRRGAASCGSPSFSCGGRGGGDLDGRRWERGFESRPLRCGSAVERRTVNPLVVGSMPRVMAPLRPVGLNPTLSGRTGWRSVLRKVPHRRGGRDGRLHDLPELRRSASRQKRETRTLPGHRRTRKDEDHGRATRHPQERNDQVAALRDPSVSRPVDLGGPPRRPLSCSAQRKVLSCCSHSSNTTPLPVWLIPASKPKPTQVFAPCRKRSK